MTQRERLERLADLLDTDPATWPTDGDAPVGFRMQTDWLCRTPSCGTVCCVAGLAALDPVLRADGLSLDGEPDRRHRYVVATNPATGRAEVGYRAAAAFFGVTHLFDPDEYPESDRTDPTAVAARIRKYAAELPRE